MWRGVQSIYQHVSAAAAASGSPVVPVSESRSSVRAGLAVKDSLRFMEDLAFASFPRSSLRSSFGVLVNGDSLSLLCQNKGRMQNDKNSG